MKKTLTVLILCFIASSLFAMTFEQTLKFCKTTQLWLPVLLEHSVLNGEGVCKAGGGSSCYEVSHLSADDLINQVVKICGTKVLHWGFAK